MKISILNLQIKIPCTIKHKGLINLKQSLKTYSIGFRLRQGYDRPCLEPTPSVPINLRQTLVYVKMLEYQASQLLDESVFAVHALR